MKNLQKQIDPSERESVVFVKVLKLTTSPTVEKSESKIQNW